MGIMGWALEEENERAELEEFRRKLLTCATVQRRKDDEEQRGLRIPARDNDDREEKLVCVTSGVSFLGLALVNRLLLGGYAVRVIVDDPEDVEILREMETSGEMKRCNSCMSVVMAKLTEMDGLLQAFDGCRGVFHTSAFADPSGISGYSKSMAEIEVKASENVMMACARTPSVRNCVLTSSVLACIWRDVSLDGHSPAITHDCWSNESYCIDKKLWYALGKLRAEKAAWRMAEEMGMKLTTICPGLITGPEFIRRNSTATIAYLKGAQEMFEDGLLATSEVSRLAEAHVKVYEAMNRTASGRYICFDRVIERESDAEMLAREMGIQSDKIVGNAPSISSETRFQLSNRKITCLMSQSQRICYHQS